MMEDINRWIKHNYYSKRDLVNGALRAAYVYFTADGDIQIPVNRSVYVGGHTPSGEGGVRLHYYGGDSNAYIDTAGGDLIVRSGTLGTTEIVRFGTGGTALGVNGGSVTFGGSVGTGWQGLTFNTGWEDYGSGWTGVQYKKVGDLVYLRGLCRRSSGSSALIGALPSGYRPNATVMSCQLANDLLARLDIGTDGSINLLSGSSVWVSLFNIVFSVAA